MTAPLYPFQFDAVRKITGNEPVYLGFDPGLGKSRTALEAAKLRKAKRILVVCPAIGRTVWRVEVGKWSAYDVTVVTSLADLKKEGVLILSYGMVSMADSPFPKAIAKGAEFDMTVLDEAHALKNAGANRTKRILNVMLPKLGTVIPMSGTPAPNHAGELYPILKALHPEAIRGSSGLPLQQWQFEDLFCRVSLKRFGGASQLRVIEGSRNLPELRNRLDGYMLRVRKEEVLKDLPPIRYDLVPVDVGGPHPFGLPPEVQGLSDEDLLKYLAGQTDEHVMRLRRQLGLVKVPAAIEYIDEFMEGLPGNQKLLVFAHHREVIEKLVTGLANWKPVVVTGMTTTMDRGKAVEAFLTDNRVRIFVGNIQAAGTALTLVGPTCKCSDVIFVEADYSVGNNVQAAARVHRIGQRDAVVARFLTAHGTIDSRIQAILARKAADFKALFD